MLGKMRSRWMDVVDPAREGKYKETSSSESMLPECQISTGPPERPPLSLSGRPARTQQREHWNMLKSGLVLAEARITGHAVGGARHGATGREFWLARRPFRLFSSLLFLF